MGSPRKSGYDLLARVLHARCSSYNMNMAKSTFDYVHKVQVLQKMKESSALIEDDFIHGKYLPFVGSRPLITMKHNSEDQRQRQSLSWLRYDELTEFCDFADKKTVLVDLGEDGTPLFGIQLGKIQDQDSIEQKFDATFSDLRAAFLKVQWTEASLLSKTNALLMFHKIQAFCGTCGDKTSSNKAGTSRRCGTCDKSLYPTSTPVGIVVISDKEFENCLLVRQARLPKGYYTCVAGFSDPGENLEQTVMREIAEEVGLEAKNISYVGSQFWPFPGSLMCGCYATVDNKEFVLDQDELEAGKWFSRSEVSEAINNTQPANFFSPSSKGDQLLVPPAGTISHHLIRHWVNRTPIQDIPDIITKGVI